MTLNTTQDAKTILQSATLLGASHPTTTILASLAFLLLFTRLTSGHDQHVKSSGKTVRLLPYWIPYIGHALSFGTGMNELISDIRDHTKESITAIYMGGKQHNLVTMPSVGRSLIRLRPSVLSTESLNLYIMEKFFGDRGSMGTMKREHWAHDIHNVLNILLKESFVSKALIKTAAMIEEKGANFVSFNKSIVDQYPWEKAAGVDVTNANPPTVETQLSCLVRNFVGEIACEVLMGSAFMTNNPNALQDLFTMDSKFNFFLLGFPGWIAPGLGRAVAARKRLLAAVEAFGRALDAIDDGLDPGNAWTDMSDVSIVMRERRRAWRKCNAPTDAYSAGDLAILWAMNVNANQLVFWLLYHILSQPSLKKEVLQEIAPYARVYQEKTGLHIDPPPRVTLNIDGIVKHSPVLRASLYETMRIDTSSVSYKEILTDFEVTETQQDAQINGKSQPDTYHLKRGQWLATFHAAHHNDARFFTDPTTFDHKRFLVPDASDPSKVVADKRTITPFGGGFAMCKGRTFAEREILLVVSSILTGWDIVPSNSSATWKHPGHVPGSTTFAPKSDIRVRISRR